jgi:hypothetical protein
MNEPTTFPEGIHKKIVWHSGLIDHYVIDYDSIAHWYVDHWNYHTDGKFAQWLVRQP